MFASAVAKACLAGIPSWTRNQTPRPQKIMKPKLLQHGRLPPTIESRLAHDYNVQALWSEADAKEFLQTRGSEFVALATNAISGASRELIAELPALRVISSLGVGLDAMSLETAKQRGIAVGYTPGVLNDCVADTAFALLMNVTETQTKDTNLLILAKSEKKQGYFRENNGEKR